MSGGGEASFRAAQREAEEARRAQRERLLQRARRAQRGQLAVVETTPARRPTTERTSAADEPQTAAEQAADAAETIALAKTTGETMLEREQEVQTLIAECGNRAWSPIVGDRAYVDARLALRSAIEACAAGREVERCRTVLPELLTRYRQQQSGVVGELRRLCRDVAAEPRTITADERAARGALVERSRDDTGATIRSSGAMMVPAVDVLVDTAVWVGFGAGTLALRAADRLARKLLAPTEVEEFSAPLPVRVEDVTNERQVVLAEQRQSITYNFLNMITLGSNRVADPNETATALALHDAGAPVLPAIVGPEEEAVDAGRPVDEGNEALINGMVSLSIEESGVNTKDLDNGALAERAANIYDSVAARVKSGGRTRQAPDQFIPTGRARRTQL